MSERKGPPAVRLWIPVALVLAIAVSAAAMWIYGRHAHQVQSRDLFAPPEGWRVATWSDVHGKLDDPDVVMRRWATRSISLYKMRGDRVGETSEAMLGPLKDEDAEVRVNALHVLVDLDEPLSAECDALLAEMLHGDPSPVVRRRAFETVLLLKPPVETESFGALLKNIAFTEVLQIGTAYHFDGHPVRQIGRIGPEVVGPLLEVARSEDKAAVSVALLALETALELNPDSLPPIREELLAICNRDMASDDAKLSERCKELAKICSADSKVSQSNPTNQQR